MFANAILVTKRTVALTRFTARMVFTRSASQNVGTILTLRRPVPIRHVSMANGMYSRGHKYVSRYAGQKPVLFLNRPSEVQVAHSVRDDSYSYKDTGLKQTCFNAKWYNLITSNQSNK